MRISYWSSDVCSSDLFISGATSHTGDTASPTSDALSLRNLYWHFPFYHPDFVDTRPQSAIRAGKYKLIYHYETRRVELFDLDKDPGETNDLSKRQIGRASCRERVGQYV